MSILSLLPDGMGNHYGFVPGDMRRIDVQRGPITTRWWAYVAGISIGDYPTKDAAEAAAIEFIEANPDGEETGRI